MRIINIVGHFLILVILYFPFSTNAQSDDENHTKYWFYRNRLRHFVVPGNMPGESLLGSMRNSTMHINSDDWNQFGTNSVSELDFGQQRAYQGYYLGVLATEYLLLSSYGQYIDASATLNELNLAIDACIRCDMCENKSPWFLSSASLDGFFMREDIPLDFCYPYNPLLSSDPAPYTNRFRALNFQHYNTDPVSPIYYSNPAFFHLYPGNPNWISNTHSRETPHPLPDSDLEYYMLEVMSKDEAINTLLGLAMVHKCLPYGTQEQTREKAEMLADLIIHKLRNSNASNPEDRWWIINPHGNKVHDTAGGYSGFYARGIAGAGNYITGNTYWDATDEAVTFAPSVAGSILSPYTAFLLSDIWNNVCQMVRFGAMNDHMTMDLAAMADNWQIMGVPSTAFSIDNISDHYNWETFYLLLFNFLHDKSQMLQVLTKVEDQLDAAPCTGPFKYEGQLSGNGWASALKFHADVDEQNSGSWVDGNFNGIDYMLLYNLYHITMLNEDNTMPPYINLVNRKLSEAMPYCTGHHGMVLNSSPVIGSMSRPITINAFSTIESTQLLDTTVHFAGSVFSQSQLSNCPPQGDYYPSHVTYRAGEKITLKPGFKVMPGSYFHAYIQEFNCWDPVNKSGGGIYGADFYTPADSLLQPLLPMQSNFFSGQDGYLLTANADDESSSMFGSAIAWPNPFTDVFNITVKPDKPVWLYLHLYDVNGICVYSLQHYCSATGQQSLGIDVGWLSPGVYACVLRSENQSQTINIIKQ